MKILVLSDTHGSSENLLRIFTENKDTNIVFFLGDGAQEMEWIAANHPEIIFLGIKGNCDTHTTYPLEGLVKLQDTLFFYTHGHEYKVKANLDALYITAKSAGAKVALFGHTHSPVCLVRGDVILFNPGSVNFPRNSLPSYGIIQLENQNKIEFSLVTFSTENIQTEKILIPEKT